MSEAAGIAQRAVELGILTEEDASNALQAFEAAGGPDFVDYLLETNLITLDQMGAIAPEDDLDTTFVGDDAASNEDPIVGKVFSGCYVQKKLGQGGMGDVYIAKREEDGLIVVIKFLAAEQAMNPTWRGRFLREANVLQRIEHPNIVGIFSVEGESSQPHIVMEFIDGTPLDALLEQQELLPPLEAARVARDILLALANAHGEGVIHRDIKPANVLLAHTNEVKVLDFGLAKNVESDDGLSMPGQILGTPHYMAPEQWGDHSVDARCDIFSTGATLYHLITGTVPFPGKNPQAISRRVMSGELIPPSEMAVDVPQDLELAIYRMLAVNRTFRYSSAELAAADLQKVLDGVEVEVPRLLLATAEGVTRIPLLPGTSFLIGRDDACDIPIRDRSVSRQHARLERGKTGFVLTDLGSTYGSFVGGMRVRNVVLKSGDQIKFGKVAVEFKDGGLGRAITTRHQSPSNLAVRTLPWPFVQILIELGDKRVVLSLLEDLAPERWSERMEHGETILKMRYGDEITQTVMHKVSKLHRRKKGRVQNYLFTISHENLGDDIEAWLSWWDTAQSRYPDQITPLESKVPASLFVRQGEPETREIPLPPDDKVLPVGRDDASKIRLLSRSVSRLHATLIRFHTRWVIRDEGSRFGTLLNGAQVRLSFLQNGDIIALGKVECEFRSAGADLTATTQSDHSEVDSDVFFELVNKGHAATTLGLLTFMDLVSSRGWLEQESTALFPKDKEVAESFAGKVFNLYLKHAEKAKFKLPEMLGADCGDDLIGWHTAYRNAEPNLPVQVLPKGWFPAITDSGSYKL
ncbi:MAG: protein kinase [Planctomycetes bacterium]|nr:protein kinase [Planctomycetota bacterium]